MPTGVSHLTLSARDQWCLDNALSLEQPYAAPVRDTFGVDDLDAALESDDVFGQAYAAATSLLVHCIEAAKRDNQKFGFGYPRVARCLLKHIDKIWSLAEASDSRYSAMATMRAYYKRKIRSNQQLTQEMVHAELTEAALSGYTIELCRGTPAGISGPFGDLYERAAMAFLKDRFVPASSTSSSSTKSTRPFRRSGAIYLGVSCTRRPLCGVLPRSGQERATLVGAAASGYRPLALQGLG